MPMDGKRPSNHPASAEGTSLGEGSRDAVPQWSERHPDLSFDHDRVLTDLMSRYEAILEAAEATEGWATSVKASRPPRTLMGSLGGI